MDCFDRVTPPLVAGYANLVERLWERIAPDRSSPAPTLHVVHSPIARPMSLRTRRGDHLIFDQYLGQLFSRLTRIELLDAPPPVVDAYLYRLYGQRLLVTGHFRKAAAFALAARSTVTDEEREAALAETPEQLAIRSLMTHVQEAFAIAHELMHLALHDQGVYDSLNEILDVVIERTIARQEAAPEARSDDGRMSLFHRQYLDDVRAAYERRGLDTSDLTEPDDPDTYFSGASEFDLAEYAQGREVRLEAMCDLFGATAVVNVLANIGLAATDVMATTTLALQHLRLMQFIDHFVDSQEGPNDLGDYARQSIARVSLLRTGLGFAMQLALAETDETETREVEDAVDRLHQAAVRLNRRHTSVVLDNLVLVLDLRELGDQFVADPSLAPTIDRLVADHALLRSLLGFAPAAV